MRSGQTIQGTRWPAWLNAAALLIASWGVIAALSLRAPAGAELVAAAFPPWWSAQQAFLAAAAANAAIVRTTAIPALLVVRPDDHDGLARLRDAGAWLTIDPQAIAACIKADDLTADYLKANNLGIANDFEGDELERLRQSTSKMLLAVLWLHVPVAVIIALTLGADWRVPACFMIAMALAATWSWRMSGNRPSTRLVVAVALMADVSMFVFQLTRHHWQVDMHMYFFAALAILVAYCDYRPIVAGTAAVALHHLALNFILPAAIYPGGADLGRVILHAVILLIEAGVLIWLAQTLSNLFATAAEKTAEAKAATAAEARANADRIRNEQAKRDRDAARRELSMGFERKISHVVEAVGVAANQLQGLSASMTTATRKPRVRLQPRRQLRPRHRETWKQLPLRPQSSLIPSIT